jgi:hypothetical protein
MQANRPNSPIFIVGHVHTGTSLMKSILKRNPAVFAVTGETHFYQDLLPIRREFADLDDPATRRAYVLFLIKLAYLGNKRAMGRREEYQLADFGLGEADFERIITAVADAKGHGVLFGRVNDELTAIAGKSRWVEKTPEHVHFLAQILRERPDSLIIEMVRDPRATLASRKMRQTSDGWLDAKEARESLAVDRSTNYDPILDAMMWKESINAARETRQTRARNLLTIRFEDLAREPEATVSRICEFVGLTYAADMLDVGLVNSATTDATVAGRGVSTTTVEKWRSLLTPQEIFVAQRLLRREMSELGYELTSVGVGAGLKALPVAGGTVVHLAQRIGGDRPNQVPERARATFGRMQRRLLKNLGIQR